jgi:hypothetical protein
MKKWTVVSAQWAGTADGIQLGVFPASIGITFLAMVTGGYKSVYTCL